MGDITIPEHPLLKKLMGSETKGAVSLRGYVGPSNNPGHVRLYSSLDDLTQSIEVPEADILHVDNLPESILPNGAVSIWVDKTASVVEKFERAHTAAIGSNVLRRGRLEIKVPSKTGDLQTVCQSVCSVCQSVCGVCQSVCKARIGNVGNFGNSGNFRAVCQSVCGVCQSVCKARIGNVGNFRNSGNFRAVCQSVCGVCQSVCKARLGNAGNFINQGNFSAVCQSVCGVCQSVCSAHIGPNMQNLRGGRINLRRNFRQR